MPLLFQTLLEDAGLDLKQVRQLRHKQRPGVDWLALWKSDRPRFERFQAFQKAARRSHFKEPYWASFAGVGTRTVFLGIYTAKRIRDVVPEAIDTIDGAVYDSPHDEYETALTPLLADYSARVFVDWPDREWRQLGTTPKPIAALYESYRDPPFPGFLVFRQQLSEIATLPEAWAERLRTSKGIYLLACPRTSEHYVGKADGADGFWGRWLNYAATGHGGNVRLKSRNPSDYQVTILEVAGSAASERDIIEMETNWKRKLLSREMGLNAN